MQVEYTGWCWWCEHDMWVCTYYVPLTFLMTFTRSLLIYTIVFKFKISSIYMKKMHINVVVAFRRLIPNFMNCIS